MNQEMVDTGPQSPQISARVWKSSGWRDFANTFPFAVGGFFLLVGLLVAARPRDARLAPIFFLIASHLFFSFIPLRRWGKSEYRLGFDSKTNALWIARKGKGVIGVAADADRITEISYVERKSSSLNTTWYLNPSMPFLWRKRDWLLTVRRGAGFPFEVPGSELALEAEAREVAEKANALLPARR